MAHPSFVSRVTWRTAAPAALCSWALALLSLAGCTGHPCVGTAEDPCRDPVEVTVLQVVDGDTLDVEPAVDLGAAGEVDRFRMLCIDTPETGDCGYDEATARLDELIGGKTVTLHFDGDCTGTYDRGLAYVFHGGRLVNLRMAQEGLALPIEEYFADGACCDEVVAAAEAAEAAGTGSWGSCGEDPWL